MGTAPTESFSTCELCMGTGRMLVDGTGTVVPFNGWAAELLQPVRFIPCECCDDRPTRADTRRAFTLIEMVVVILILGVLAVVAVPRLLNMSDTATDNAVRQSLAVVRDAIARYAADNGGALPGADGSEATFAQDLEDYLRTGDLPKCVALPTDEGVEMVNGPGPISGDANPSKDWRYNYETGEFIANWNQPTASDASVDYDEL